MMRLRLNGDGGGCHILDSFEHDVNISSSTKVDVLNFIGIVVKNLIDKPNELKYRQLRLNNSKIQRYTSSHTSIMNYLQQIIGFERITDIADASSSTTSATTAEPLLRIVDALRVPTPDALQIELRTIKSMVQRIESTAGVTTTTSTSTTQQPRVISNSSSTTSLESEENTTTTIGTTTMMTTKLTEKQRSRLLMEEKVAVQKVQEEQARKRTIQQIQNDKFVRQNDPNWKPSVSAAAAKSGDTMSTFRDKFGES